MDAVTRIDCGYDSRGAEIGVVTIKVAGLCRRGCGKFASCAEEQKLIFLTHPPTLQLCERKRSVQVNKNTALERETAVKSSSI